MAYFRGISNRTLYIIIGCIIIAAMGYSYTQQVEGYTNLGPTNQAIYAYFKNNAADIKSRVSKDGDTGKKLYDRAVAFFKYTGTDPSNNPAVSASASPRTSTEIANWFEDASNTGAKSVMLKDHSNFAYSLMNFVGVPTNYTSKYLH